MMKVRMFAVELWAAKQMDGKQVKQCMCCESQQNRRRDPNSAVFSANLEPE